MSNARGKGKARAARRAHKVSKGLNRHSKHPLTALQKVLIGKGFTQRTYGFSRSQADVYMDARDSGVDFETALRLARSGR